MATKVINSLTFGDTYVLTTPYATCSTAAGTAAKVATITPGSNFSLETGARIAVKFTNALSVAAPTLNVNSSGAKAIYFRGATLTSAHYWAAGSTVDFVFDGTYWQMLGAQHNNTYSLSSFGITATAAELNTLDGITASVTELNYTEGVTSNIQTQLNSKISTNMGYVNKSLTWNSNSYLQHVILLFPAPQSTTYCGHNYIDGKFFCWKTGGNVYDTIEINANCVYGCLRYHLEQFGDHPSAELCVCKYNNVQYYALKCPYHANPYTNVTFIGRIRSDGTGGTSTVALPLDVPYYDENTATVLNSEVKTSLTTTLTTTYVTSASTTALYSKGGFAGNLTGNASTATNVAWSGVTGKPTYYDAKAIKGITRSGTTFTYTCMDGTTGTFTQQDSNTTYTFTNNGPTLAWGTTSTIGTVGGTALTVTMPANPNTNTAHTHTAGTGLTVSGSGGTSGTTTYSANLNSTTSLGTIGTTSKLYAVGVDANGQLCVNVPWTDNNTDTKVTQAADTTATTTLPVLLGYTSGTTATTQTVKKNSAQLNFTPGATYGTLTVKGDIIAGGGSDSYGIHPATNNYSTLGKSDLKWFKIYGTNIYGTTIYEGGTALSSKYAAASHTHTMTMTWNTF